MLGEFFGKLRRGAHHSDAVLAVALIGIVLLLIVPLPSAFLDTFLCFNIVFSVMALLLTVYVEKALEFNSFPSFLLFLTLYRLGLNISSTRLILTHGEGGAIIETFGKFVTQNNLTVGLILFVLLTVINFIVVSKGAGRIAEVAARFTLEALPGKQIAIDSELSNGGINQEEAKKARETITKEAEFYGAMDGASKFVRGDAIAGLIITGVNIIGGLFIGIGVKGMPWLDCLKLYTQLTIGDGLVSQIPALLVSVGAGIMVTRASSGSLGKTMTRQVFHHPKVLMITAVTLFVLSLLPGMPFFIMTPIALALVLYAWLGLGGKQKEKLKSKEGASNLFAPVLEVQLGYQVVSLSDPLYKKLPEIRQEVGQHLGIRVPSIHISDSLELPSAGWAIRVKGISVATGNDATLKNLTLRLTEAIEKHAHELINRQDVTQMINDAKNIDSAVVEELAIKKLGAGPILKVLQNLLRERIPIRDFVSILEILADHAQAEKQFDVAVLTDQVRKGLARRISDEFFGKAKVAHVITLDPKVEQMFEASQGNLRPITVDKLMKELQLYQRKGKKEGIEPVVVTTASRSRLKQLIEKQLPDLNVLSYGEITQDVEFRSIGIVSKEVLI